MRFMMFSKSLQSMSVLEAGQVVKSLGFDGIELTVRPKGHVLPENVREDLPRALDQLRGIGLDVATIVTEVHSTADPLAHDVCATAARAGVRLLRTSARRYKPFGSIRAQIAEARREAAELEALGREYGVMLCIQTHSGEMLSANAGILDQILAGTDPRYVGVGLSPGHLVLEGSAMGWMQSLDLFQDRIGMVDAKSYAWFKEPDAASGETTWVYKKVPLEDGSVRWRVVFNLLRQVGWDADGQAVVALGCEYEGGSWRNLSVPELIDQSREDLAYIRRQAELAMLPNQSALAKKSKNAKEAKQAEPVPA